MGELKPIGSEKLKGNDKLKRILELTYYQSPDDSKKSNEIVKETKTGVYGIVKEKDGYYVKRGLTESSLDYIGGLFMKNKNRYTSYGEAFKKAEFLVKQENLQEATKYVLKKPEPPVPQEEHRLLCQQLMLLPACSSGTDATAPASPDGTLPPPDETDSDKEAPEGEDDYLNVIQKYTGRLQAKINEV